MQRSLISLRRSPAQIHAPLRGSGSPDRLFKSAIACSISRAATRIRRAGSPVQFHDSDRIAIFHPTIAILAISIACALDLYPLQTYKPD